MSQRLPKFRGFSRAKAIGRVVVYLMCLNLAVSACYVKYARAEAEQAVSRGGLELLQKLGPKLMGESQAVQLNGQRMFLSSKSTHAPLAEVLDALEQHCQHPASRAGVLGAPATATQAAPAADDWNFSRLLVSRLEQPDGAAGQVACLAARDGDTTFDAFTHRLVRFAKTLDLAALGEMRYGVARHDAKTGVTHLLVLWTEGSLAIPVLFPAHGDAPGSDSAEVPRPPDSVRVLAAEVSGHPYALRQYDSAKSEAEVLAAYETNMKARGWSLAPLAAGPASAALAPHWRSFVKDAAAVFVLVGLTPQGKTGVSLVEMGTPGHVRVTRELAE